MSQGGQGGGYPPGIMPTGLPPGAGGWGQPGGGYGQQPGGGYGQQPGWGPPQGQMPHGHGGPPPGGNDTMSRLLTPAILGGLIGGVLCAIPIFNLLNCCFCILNMIGSASSVALYLRGDPTTKIRNSEAALCGAIAGAIAGLIWIVSTWVFALILGTFLTSLYTGWFPAGALTAALIRPTEDSLARIPGTIILFAGFGTVGAFVTAQVFFKNRVAD